MSSIVTNPIHVCISRIRALLASYIQSIDVRHGDKWLDVGCGERPYEVFFRPALTQGSMSTPAVAPPMKKRQISTMTVYAFRSTMAVSMGSFALKSWNMFSVPANS